MTGIGFVALFIWDGVFPDRRDARILTPLPVPGRVLIGARLLALGTLCAIFIVGINAFPTVFYAPTITHFGGATNQVQGLLAFVLVNAFAGIFVFATMSPSSQRHGPACPGHPRLSFRESKTWMPGTRACPWAGQRPDPRAGHDELNSRRVTNINLPAGYPSPGSVPATSSCRRS